ncbi:MAG: hypothetical protein O2968_05165 [Acidobacteria bacterium]|nr:hypothetical protein [Acidobacteriota bacterium]
MTVEGKLLELAKKLVSKTDSGTAAWEESGESEKYVTSIPHFSVAIASTSAQDSWDNYERGYTISLIDEAGRTIEHLYGGEYSSEGKRLAELYVRAKRKAHGVEQALDEILSALG